MSIRRIRPLVPVLCLLAVLGLAACAAGQPHPLLQREPAAMSDADLLRYYYELGEAVAACEADDDPRVGFGLGAGTGGGGVGITVTNPMGGGGCDADALRQRRVDVQLLLRQRGVEP
ncbi:MAG: hypothetical protein AB7D57_01570 [Desulfovibrionaceae bacterium]